MILNIKNRNTKKLNRIEENFKKSDKKNEKRFSKLEKKEI